MLTNISIRKLYFKITGNVIKYIKPEQQRKVTEMLPKLKDG